jgi:starvation-inducible DNA-binding protein
MENQIGLKTADAVKIAEKLNVLLSDIQIFYANVRGMHWNVTRKQFFVLHEKFEEIYTGLSGKADAIAERILILGQRPVHRFSQYLKIAVIKETEILSSAEDTVNEVLKSLKLLLKQEREIVTLVSELGDEGTVDLLTGYISEQEKMIWMFSMVLK